MNTADIIGKIRINNFPEDTQRILDEYPYISVRVVEGELWYYGADKTRDHARRTVDGIQNAFVINLKDIV